ncbi:Holliday junction resolvase RuvX [Mobiluncus curtisii]|jgi:hypothetical protein|uniref:Holliday junction resolvase RuvX n=1 Tax=Mobiluncus curtisii TaxID=2051 RepID=UPI0014702E79|nr:Holliday junction resolvase RuvX [Mobiluncus curtisii]MCV0021642.1 Holliday junction resolvase RuvX [Mobiluncus curtisii]NMW47833.1 Holliday junction resolvase RuvX [Mobiluncus curtisii]
MVAGNFLAIDVGKARIGVARSVSGTSLALPVETLQVQPDGSELDELLAIITESNPAAVFVGLPKLMSGKEGEAARMARSYARRLVRRLGELPVHLIDERLSSADAHAKLQQVGVCARRQKEMVDQLAAVTILTRALETLTQTGNLPGELVII